MPKPDGSPHTADARSLRGTRLWALSVCALGLLVSGGLYLPLLHREKDEIREEWRGRLAAMADDREAAIRDYLAERAGDARTLAGLPRAAEHLEAVRSGFPLDWEEASRNRLEAHLSNLRANHGYASVYCLDSQGRTVASSPGAPALDSACAVEALRTLQGGADRFVDLHRHASGELTFSHHALVRNPADGSLLGVVVLVTDPNRWLYPLLRRQPLPTLTSETLIGAVWEGRLAFLSPLRFGSPTPPSYPVASPGETLALRAAVESRETFGEFSDYRGEDVLAATRHIEGTPWGLVAKVDRAEAFERLSAWTAWYVLLSGLGVLALTLLVYGFLRRQRLRLLEALSRQEGLYRALSEQTRDVFLLARPDGAIVEANAAAERAYGFSREELLRMNIRDLRAPAARGSFPVALAAALSPGGSLHETVHLSRTGVEFPVEIRAQEVVLGSERLVAGIIRDISERRTQERRILKLNRLYRTLSEANQALVRAGSQEELLRRTCQVLVDYGGFLRACVALLPPGGAKGAVTAASHPEEPVCGCADQTLPDPLPATPVVLGEGETQHAFLPLWQNGALHGVLCVASAEAAAFDPEVMGLLGELAMDLSFALEVQEIRRRREEAEGALQEKEARLRNLVENMATCVALYEPVEDGTDFLIQDLNAAAERSSHVRREDAIGRRVTDAFPGVRAMGLFDVFRRVHAGGPPERHPVSLYRDERLTLWADNYVYRLPSGHIVAVYEDVTERKLAEEALKENEERLRLALRATSQGLFDLNVQTGACVVSPEYASMLGFDPDAFVETNQAWIERLHPEDRERAAEAYRAYVAGEVPEYRVEFRQRCADGSWKWILSLGRIVEFDTQGRPLRMLGTHTDITERKTSEEVLRRHEASLRGLYESMSEMLALHEVVYDPSGRAVDYRILECNAAYERVTGIPRSKACGALASELYGANEAPYLDAYARVAETGMPVQFEAEFAPMNKHFLVSAYSPEKGRFATLALDVTDRVRSQAEQRFLYRAMNAGLNEIYVFDSETWKFEFVSRGGLLNLGYTLEEMKNKTPVDIKPAFTEDSFREAVAPLLSGELQVLHFETDHERADGTRYPVEIHLQLFDQGKRKVFVAFILDITERKRAQEALRESEEKYRRLHESMTDAFVQTDMTGRIVAWNPAYRDMLGHTDDELPTLSYPQITPSEWHESEARIVREQILPMGYSGVYEKEYIRKDGTRFPVELRTFLLRDEAGEPSAMWAIVRDISERKKAEASLRESEEKYRSILENMQEGYYEVDLAGNLTFFNDSLCALFGYPREELMGMNNRRYTDAENARKLYQAFNEVYRTGVSMRGFGWEVLRSDGTARTIEASVSLRRNAEGRPIGFRGLIRDVTEERRAQEALRQSEERFRTLFENSPVGMYRTTPDGRIVEANPKIVQLLGFRSFEELASRNLEEDGFEPSYPREAFKAEMERAGEVRGLESVWRTRDGQVLRVREHARAVRDDLGRVVCYDGVIEDVSAVYFAEKARHLLATAIEQSHDAVVITDRDGSILYVNPAFERITGYSREEAVGQNPRILKSGVHDDAFYKDLWDTILSGRVWSGRLTNRRKDGSHFVEQAVISPVRDEDGAIVTFVAAKRDVTQEVDLEKRLEHAKSLETIGMVAGGMAHEVRNPLFAISTLTTALDRKFGENEEIKPYIGFIQEHVQRLTTLMNDLLALGRPLARDQFVPCNLCGLAQSAKDLLAKEDPEGASRLDVDCTAGDAQLLGQADKISQVLLNLVQNALHFSPPEGRVLLQVRRRGGIGEVRVVDRGSGIPADFLPRLFQPFASRRQGGTGLGLALVRKLVEAHGGTVDGANNEPGPGATFTVRLPLVRD